MLLSRKLTISLFSLCLLQSAGNLIFLYWRLRYKRILRRESQMSEQRPSTTGDRRASTVHKNGIASINQKLKSTFGQLSKHKDALEVLTNMVFIIHAACGIKVSLDIEGNVFDVLTVTVLVISCACSLVYAILMSLLLSLKLKAMDFQYGHLLFLYAIAAQIALKLASFLVVFYLLFSNWGASDLLAPFLTPLGTVGSYLNLTGNQIYTDFIAVTTVLYARFMHKFLWNHQLLGKAGSENRQVGRWTIVMLSTSLAICFTALVFSILNYKIIPHPTAIALNSYVSSFLSCFNIWLDNGVLKIMRQSRANKTARSISGKGSDPHRRSVSEKGSDPHRGSISGKGSDPHRGSITGKGSDSNDNKSNP